MKPVRFRTATATITVGILNISLMLERITSIGLGSKSYYIVIVVIVTPVTLIICKYLSKGYDETDENNDSIFNGLLVFFLITFFFLLFKFYSGS